MGTYFKMENQKITIETEINAPIEKVWEYWTNPEHITKWNTSSSEWHSPRAENDVRVGGKFNIRMEAKDGSSGFDFSGTYEEVKENEFISYSMDDGRKVEVKFEKSEEGVNILETFDAEGENSIEMQKQGWQSILDNFKKYVEEDK